MKICVYAISKNEEKFAKRWYESMKEADEVIVLDTGSTDNTVKILKKLGAHVISGEITPWRFDTARNASLALVPEDADICVCTDLDEVFHSGWRKALEKAWEEGTTRARYRYTWSFNADGSEGTVFWSDKIHLRFNYTWKGIVHETLHFNGKEEKFIDVKDMQLDHKADLTKSRAQYLPLLELAVEEEPENDRNMHYLGREYYFNKKYEMAIRTLKRHLKMKNSLWRDERATSYRYIAKSYVALGSSQEAYKNFLCAIAEAPHLRETWLDMAYFEFDRQNYLGCIYFTEYALTITERPKTYINEPRSWDSTPYDILSISYYHLGDNKKAISNIKKAIALSDEERLKENLKLYEEKTP